MTRDDLDALAVAEKQATAAPWSVTGAVDIAKFGPDWANIAQACNPRADGDGLQQQRMERADIGNERFGEAAGNAKLIAALRNHAGELLRGRAFLFRLEREWAESLAACCYPSAAPDPRFVCEECERHTLLLRELGEALSGLPED